MLGRSRFLICPTWAAPACRFAPACLEVSTRRAEGPVSPRVQRRPGRFGSRARRAFWSSSTLRRAQFLDNVDDLAR
eukprot:11197747-Lingulodinium_polyedra.AAC.1